MSTPNPSQPHPNTMAGKRAPVVAPAATAAPAQDILHAPGVPCGAEVVPTTVCHSDPKQVTCEPCLAARFGEAWAKGVGTFPEPIPLGQFLTKDSGERRAFATGSQRDNADGKGRYDLLPREAIHRLAQLYERGAAKYDDRNWEKGQPFSAVINSMLRHAHQAAAGLTDEDHLAAVAWNAFALITMQERIAAGTLPPELDDMPHAA